MENKDWINDYKLLKQISPANPFIVPAGYFDELGDHIVSLKNLEEIKSNNPEGGFTIPENYFDGLTANIQSRLSIETFISNEETGFAVPDGYFDEFASNIESRLAIETMLSAEETGFAVPDGYFEELTSNIQGRIFIEEALGEIAEPFAVPSGYFEALNTSILDKTVNAGDVKGNGVIRKLFTSTAFKYATAACFAVAIGSGILISELTSPEYVHNHSFLHKQLSDVPISAIKTYLQLNVDAGDTQQTVTTQGSDVNDADLKEALKNYADSVQ
jgi:hypothetical protein